MKQKRITKKPLAAKPKPEWFENAQTARMSKIMKMKAHQSGKIFVVDGEELMFV
jgi:hypothetical protein